MPDAGLIALALAVGLAAVTLTLCRIVDRLDRIADLLEDQEEET